MIQTMNHCNETVVASVEITNNKQLEQWLKNQVGVSFTDQQTFPVIGNSQGFIHDKMFGHIILLKTAIFSSFFNDSLAHMSPMLALKFAQISEKKGWLMSCIH